MGKQLATAVVGCLVFCSLLVIPTSNAQLIPKPSIPQFTLSLEGNYIKIIIVNQPFTPYSVNDNICKLYYTIRWKEHSDNYWTYLMNTNTTIFEASTSSVTIVLCALVSKNKADIQIRSITAGDQVDFKVEAKAGYYYYEPTPLFSYFHGQLQVDLNNSEMHRSFFSANSGYSSTQTIAVPATTLSPNPSPTVPEFPIIALLALVVIPITFLIVKRKSTKNTNLTLIH
jgi:hypothetical protein